MALGRLLGFENRAHDAEGHEHPAATEVADQVDRRRRLATGTTEVRQRAGDCDVVDVVACGLCHRTLLTPSRHAAVDQSRVAGKTHVGSQAESLGHARPIALDERVSLLDERQDEFDAVGVLEVDADGAPAAVQRLEVGLVERRRIDLLTAVDPNDVGAHVGEQHPRERSRADSRELDDLDALQRSH